MYVWQRRLFLFLQEWLGAIMLLWLRYEKDPLLNKAAIGYAVSMVVAWAMYLDVGRRLLAWRAASRGACREIVATRGPSRAAVSSSDAVPHTLRSGR